ncbi:DegV family protein [Aeromicrobium sp. IC_218]|uniref:DegV family protein n=1 Tax=Aeromicrobium sp. IC_218 TaxID=2545468 RepID=UPI00103EA525|nr:DegV family protein [Aeromicrobium sp. IC_218]TCI97363.1 DegV family protein [Aeromicrobium sp. IC_218]
MTVALVTDSTATLPGGLVELAGATVVPLHVVVGAETHLDGTVPSAVVADALRHGVPVSTSRPSPERFADVYAEAAEAGADHVVSVHLSAGVSGTYDAALLAARDAPVPVHVVDSTQVGMAVAFSVLAAARTRDEGASAEDVAAAAERAGRTSTSLLYVDTLEHLRRGGRIGAASALLGTALAVKPLLTIDGGEVRPLEKVRTASRAIGRLEALAVEAARACPGGCDVGVQHLAAEEQARGLVERLGRELGRDDLLLSEVSPVLGAHVGPGLLGISITPR